jgi:hypothetical protein
MEKAPGGSFFFAENGYNSFKEIAEMIAHFLGLGGTTVSLPLEDVVRQSGKAGRLGVGSNSFISAVNARRLGWAPKASSSRTRWTVLKGNASVHVGSGSNCEELTQGTQFRVGPRPRGNALRPSAAKPLRAASGQIAGYVFPVVHRGRRDVMRGLPPRSTHRHLFQTPASLPGQLFSMADRYFAYRVCKG